MPGAAATTPKPKRKRKVKLRIRRSPPQESEKRLLRELLNHADEKQIGALYNWAAGTRYHRKSGEQLLEAPLARDRLDWLRVCDRLSVVGVRDLTFHQPREVGVLFQLVPALGCVPVDVAVAERYGQPPVGQSPPGALGPRREPKPKYATTTRAHDQKPKQPKTTAPARIRATGPGGAWGRGAAAAAPAPAPPGRLGWRGVLRTRPRRPSLAGGTCRGSPGRRENRKETQTAAVSQSGSKHSDRSAERQQRTTCAVRSVDYGR